MRASLSQHRHSNAASSDTFAQSMFDSQLQECSEDKPWLFSTKTPSLADLSLYYQLEWANDISAGKGIENLTAGGTTDTQFAGTTTVFNEKRHPHLVAWFQRVKDHLKSLPMTEKAAASDADAIELLKAINLPETPQLIPTRNQAHAELSKKTGLVSGAEVSVGPDDTGRAE